MHVHYRHDPRSYVKPYGSATELRSKKETGSPKASRLTRTIPSTTLHGASSTSVRLYNQTAGPAPGRRPPCPTRRIDLSEPQVLARLPVEHVLA